MIEEKIEAFDRRELITLRGGLDALTHHLESRRFPELPELMPSLEEEITLMSGILEALKADVAAALIEKHIGDDRGAGAWLPEWRSFINANQDEVVRDEDGNRIWPEGDTP